jgi:solute carrier family 35 protein C2
MCKSSVLGFVLLFAFLFRLETPSLKLFLTIVTMTAGVLLMVAGETAFDVLGFVLVMTAASSSGFRWSLTQILLIRNPATSNPFATLFYLAPVMFFTLLVLAIPVEGFIALGEAFHTLAQAKGYLLSFGILLFPGCLAFLMTSSEFALLQRTSVVTLSICGIFKEVLTITAGTVVFKDKLTPVNFSGLAVTIATIAVYNWMKIKKMREESERDAHLAVSSSEGSGGYAPVRMEDECVEERQERRRSHSNSDVPGRGSLGDVIRQSLSLGTRGHGQGQNDPSPTSRSPVKKPENLE